MGKQIDDELYGFLERVIDSAYTFVELKIAANWIATYCRDDSSAMEYFKDQCLTQHDYICQINQTVATDQWLRMMGLSENDPKDGGPQA